MSDGLDLGRGPAMRAGQRNRPVRVLAVDDSAVMRGLLRRLFQMPQAVGCAGLPAMELCGLAEDGVEGLDAARRLAPDVILLDLEMPRMHGLDTLDCLRREMPGLRVIMCSAHTERGARSTLDALARGASDYVTKPVAEDGAGIEAALRSLERELLPRIAALMACPAAAAGKAIQSTQNWNRPQQGGPAGTECGPRAQCTPRLLVIGVSTGGPSALEQMLPRLPAGFPVPVLIVQHMPKLFTGALAERLDNCCAMPVREAYEGALAGPGSIWIAPGDTHLEVGASFSGGAGAVLHLQAGEPVNYCRPAVDRLFFSAARIFGAETLALVMTGMGQDGLAGARAVHRAGGMVLAQDQASSAVWGMPGRISDSGIADAVVGLSRLADELCQRIKGRFHPASASGKTVREAAYGLL